MPPRKPARKKFDSRAGARAIARERVGTVKATKVVVSKLDKPPKHRKQVEEQE